MMNNRPIDDPRLQKALDEAKAVFGRYGFAGAVMIVGPKEAAFAYHLHAPWSMLRQDPTLEIGFRMRASSRELGLEEAHRRIEGGVGTICQLHDFGYMTASYMEDLMKMIREAGIDFEHTPFNGEMIRHLTAVPPEA